MSLIKFSDVIRDVNWPTVWRYEFAAEGGRWDGTPQALVAGAAATTMYTHNLTLGESSNVRFVWSGAATSPGGGWGYITLQIVINGWLCWQGYGSGYNSGGTVITSTVQARGTVLMSAGGPWPMVFNALAVTANMTLSNWSAEIDVCRA